jgi:hypothetical protein
MCYYAGDTHPGFDGPGTSTQPDLTTGCQDDLFQNGDLDFDGSPYWTESHALGSCALEFGNVSGRGPFLTDFGKDAQYGQDLFTTLGYPEFEGPAHNNTCDYHGR